MPDAVDAAVAPAAARRLGRAEGEIFLLGERGCVRAAGGKSLSDQVSSSSLGGPSLRLRSPR